MAAVPKTPDDAPVPEPIEATLGGSVAEEEPKEECKKCVAGAPAWMATFADMATLLMAFFVLILSFAEMNVPKYKQISGSLKMAFGVQRIVPTVEPPKAQSVIAQHFSPARAEPTPQRTVQQRTTDETQPEVEMMVDVGSSDFENNADYRVLQEALEKEIARGQVSIKVKDDKLVVELQGTQSRGSADGQQDRAESLKGGMSESDEAEMMARIAEAQALMTSEVEVQLAGDENTAVASAAGTGGPARDQSTDDQLARIRAELSADIENGLAEVERDGDRIIIRLGEQGGFVSGRAELQASFTPLLGRVASAVSQSDNRITIEGHTDNVPIMFSERFRSNWELSAARSAAVADYLLGTSSIQDGRIMVAGFADTRPLDTNDTAAGRSRNRRIEVILD